jgi:hypothetical protein
VFWAEIQSLTNPIFANYSQFICNLMTEGCYFKPATAAYFLQFFIVNENFDDGATDWL